MIPTSKANPTCQSCPSYATGGSRLIRPSGTGAIPLLVLTDQPSECEETYKIDDGGGMSLNKRSPGGYTFTKACDKIGISRDQVWAWSMLKCLPPQTKNDPLSIISMTQCHNHLVSFVAEHKPQAILALGDAPIRWLTGYQGKKQGHMNLRGYILDNQRFPDIPVIASIDPVHITNVGKPILRRALAYDLHKAIGIAQSKGEFERPNEDRYELFPPLDRLREMYTYLKEHPQSPIYYDIETHESFLAEEQDLRAGRYGEVYKVSAREHELDPGMDADEGSPWDDSEAPEQAELLSSRSIITQIQFACDIPDWAIAVAWNNESAAITRDIFALPNLRVNVNRRVFDDPILRYSGVPLSDHALDLMDCLHESTIIHMQSGAIQIKDLNDSHIGQLVLSASSTGERKWVPLAKVHKRYDPTVQWLRVKLDNCRDTTKATPEHPFWTRRGWVEAQHLTSEDYVLSGRPGANDVIEGLMLGDGYHDGRNIQVGHAANQYDYSAALGAFFGTVPFMARRGISTIGFRAPKHMREDLKLFKPPSTDRALAVWFMDDGHCGRNRIVLSAAWATNPDAMQEWFLNDVCEGNPSGLKFAPVVLAGNRYPGFRIEFTGVALRAIQARIAPWVLPCMQYKLQEAYRHLCRDWSTQEEFQWAKVEYVKPHNVRSEDRHKYRYCIDVEDSFHAFVANNTVVHNCWHRYEPDLPKSLGFITPFFWPTVKPWKHLSQSEPGVYGCRDVISLQKIHQPLIDACKQDRIWTSFQVHDMQLGPALDRIQARGYPCDAKRKDHFGAVLQRYVRILKSRMAGLYPQSLLPFDKNSGPYEEKPTKLKKDFGEDNLCEALVEIEETHKLAELRTRKGKTPPPEAVELVGQYIDKIPPELMSWFKVKETKTGRQIKAMRWVYRKNFNPQSRDQVLAYLESKCEEEWQSYVEKDLTFQAQFPGLTLKKAAEQGPIHVSPRGWKSKHAWFVPPNPKEKVFKPWVSSRGLKRLMRSLKAANVEDPLLPLLVKTTAHSKMFSSFVQTWKPSIDNLVHTTFKFSPATPQLAAVNPNILAAPAHGALAKRWKWTQKAHTGKRFINFDYGGFHCITTGFLAKDPSYIYAARIDIHGILGYISEKLPHWDRLVRGLTDHSAMPREELAKLVKDARTNAPLSLGMTFKERRDEIYKRTILGVQLGMGAYTMYMNAPEAFGSRQYAQSIIDQEKQIWPKIFKFQDEERASASVPPNLSLDAYGYLRRFEEVNRSEWSAKLGRWETKPGPDSEKALAAKVQGIAFGFIRDGLIWLDKARCPITGMTWADKFGLCNGVHDSFVFHCPEEHTEECLSVVGTLLQRRSKILVNEVVPDGLWCKVEASVGAVHEGYDTCKEVAIPIGPFDFPVEAVVGWKL